MAQVLTDRPSPVTPPDAAPSTQAVMQQRLEHLEQHVRELQQVVRDMTEGHDRVATVGQLEDFAIILNASFDLLAGQIELIKVKLEEIETASARTRRAHADDHNSVDA